MTQIINANATNIKKPFPFAYAYVRTSTSVPGDVLTQLCEIRDASARLGLPVSDIYADIGVSGSDAKKPWLESLLRDVSGARVRPCAVFVASATRIGRRPSEVRRVTDALSAVGVVLVVVDQAPRNASAQAHSNGRAQ